MAQPWRVLIVEDLENIGKELIDGLESPGWLDQQTAFITQWVKTFEDGLARLEDSRFDMVVLDLKDDAREAASVEKDDPKPGLAILERIRKTRFVPVVFYTALPEHVVDLKSSFVRVVEKSEGFKQVRVEIAHILKTKLPTLSRYLEEQQRKYFWDFVEKELPEDLNDGSVDLAHLMARRLSAGLRMEFSKTVVEQLGDGAAAAQMIHPMEFYILPTVSTFWMAGDLVREHSSSQHYVVLTPTCDFANEKAKKVDFIVLGKCVLLTDCDEYKEWSGDPPQFTGADKNVQSLMRDNRGGQRERYTFLPGTSAFPDLVVDLQQLLTVPKHDEGKFERLASLDSPFGEKLLSMFARYYGRIGAPNLDIALAISRAKDRATKASAKPVAEPGSGSAPRSDEPLSKRDG